MPKHLVIVESPAKAKTIKRFLGKDYDVEASMGHVRDLPSSTIAVDVERDFEPEYEVPDEKKTVVKKLKDARKKADDLWIATDEDREGEAIGWHLCKVLKEDPKTVSRIAFHEITETAIRHAVENPRRINMKLVGAQQARRVLDRLVGYTLSPFLWKKVYRGLSAGRVQSVAVRIIVDRERAIKAFKPEEYWSIEALLENSAKQTFTAALSRKGGQKCEPESEAEVKRILADLEGAQYEVSAIEKKELKKTPPPPFTTSTLQQEAARKLGFSVKQTMVIAQQLYEGVSLGKGAGHTGLITYMRTDSHNLSQKALDDAMRTIESHYGREYVLAEPRIYKKKSKGAQEAHEAIRPTEMERIPASIEDVLDHQQLKLYTLIWNRTMATQMAAAELKRVGVDISALQQGSGQAPNYIFRATGQTVVFDGFLRLYQEGRDEDHVRKEDDVDEGDKLLPPLEEGEQVALVEPLKTEQHFTKPPPRYTEASLVKKMEEEGIGRPSTYAPTISTIQQRGYIVKDGKQLVPQDVAFMVTDLLTEHFPDVVNLAFTAHMEQKLDSIAEGEETAPKFLKTFYGPFKMLVDKKTDEIRKSDVMKERELGTDPSSGLPVIARIGRFGPYVQLGRFEPSSKISKMTRGKKTAGSPKEAKQKLKSASLPKNVSIDNVTLELALGLLSFPRELGAHDGNMIIIFLGRFGPYLKCGDVTTTLPKDRDPVAITLQDAVAIMAESQAAKKKAAAPLRELGADPMTGARVLIKDGRFGPYATDGKTNASLGKKRDPQTITLEEAADLLAKKRIRGPSKWRRRF
ncbi:type I DNA topoisomerase [Candidatus Peregrinibacteria bacterium]|nr:type I DNA topoisomerase [Candidatus Peregrinibacteria bacterium]